VAPGMSVPWGDRAPKLHAGFMRGAPPGERQSVSGKNAVVDVVHVVVPPIIPAVILRKDDMIQDGA